MVKTIEYITGSVQSVTSTARLEKFSGSLEELSRSSIPDSLLTADNTDVHPKSYYLSAEQNARMDAEEYFYDAENGKFFYKTDFRLDEPRKFKRMFAANKDESCIVFFTHEWLLDIPPRRNVFKWATAWIKSFFIWRNIEKMCSYAKNGGYTFITDFNGVNYGR